MPDCLIEFLSEEIPARMQKNAVEHLQSIAKSWFAENRLSYTQMTTHVTPRRLILSVSDLPECQTDLKDEKKGPSISAPTKALEGFLNANNAQLDDCVKRDTGKGEYFFLLIDEKGQRAEEILKVLPNHLFKNFNWPKSMRWSGYQSQWVRPIRQVLAIFNGQKIKGKLDAFNMEYTDQTHGHRFLAPKSFSVKNFADYQLALEEAFVLIDRDSRKEIIAKQAKSQAEKKNLVFKADEGLLEEVAGLVEWPVPMIGQIDKAFMDVPEEVLVTSMRVHQKYFPLYDQNGKLAPHFVLVANLPPNDGGEVVIAGNEKVLRARLSDAKFFWDQDLKSSLASRIDSLKQMRFHDKLGSIYQKSERLEKLVSLLSKHLLSDHKCNVPSLQKAAQLCKADLTSSMVFEFPEVQGVMGGHYALNDGETAATSFAIRDHYKPAGANDNLPETIEGAILSIADKLDALVGFFSVGLKPTSSKDPFALRRSCLGIIRIIKHYDFNFSFEELSYIVFDLYCQQSILDQQKNPLPVQDLVTFFEDRFKVFLKENDVRYDFIQAVFEGGRISNYHFVFEKIAALMSFFEEENGAFLLSLFKRANNILGIEEAKDKTDYSGSVDQNYLEVSEEKILFSTLDETEGSIKIALDKHDYKKAMVELSKLSAPVNDFFDKVMVNVDNEKIRRNRLQLLAQIRTTMNKIIEFSAIEDK